MSLHLPDINVLVALLWTNHEQHAAASRWFRRPGLAVHHGAVLTTFDEGIAALAGDDAGLIRSLTILERKSPGLPLDQPLGLSPWALGLLAQRASFRTAEMLSILQSSGPGVRL